MQKPTILLVPVLLLMGALMACGSPIAAGQSPTATPTEESNFVTQEGVQGIRGLSQEQVDEIRQKMGLSTEPEDLAILERLINYQFSFREELGLPSDPAHIYETAMEVLETRQGPRPQDYGLFLSEAESAELAARTASGGTMTELDEWLKDAYPEVYGGIYLDHQAGGVVKALFTRLDEVDQEAIAARFAAPERLQFEVVEHSWAKLHEQYMAASLGREELREQGVPVTTVELRVTENAVYVRVEEVSSEKVEAIKTAWGDNITVRQGSPDGVIWHSRN